MHEVSTLCLFQGVLRSIGNDTATKRSVIVIAHRYLFLTQACFDDWFNDTSSTLCSFRLSTNKAADRIVAMDSGRVVEVTGFVQFIETIDLCNFNCYVLCAQQMGNHEELMSKDGLYARLTKRRADAVV